MNATVRVRVLQWAAIFIVAVMGHFPIQATPHSLANTKVAITVDDLPWVGPGPAQGTTAEAVGRIAAILRAHNAPATGFAVCDRAQENEAQAQILRNWAAWGFKLGNHSSAHEDLNRVSVHQWLESVQRCDQYLKHFTRAYTPLIRFPLLHQGDTEQKRFEAQAGLEKLGLGTAHVSVDTSDWIFNSNHAGTLQKPNARLRHINGQAFIQHIVAAIEHANRVSVRKEGRVVPQVLLLHANTLLEDKLDELLLALRRQGVQFISLEQALSDPVYAKEDGYVGGKGLSWLYRMNPLSVDDAQWDEREARAAEQLLELEDNKTGTPRAELLPNLARVTNIRADKSVSPDIRSLIISAADSERMRSLLVMSRGKLVVEAYFNGAGPESATNLKSVTKTLVSALVGVALKNKWIGSVDDTIGQYLGIAEDSPASTITLRALLTMSSGLKTVSYADIQTSGDWLESILLQPVLAQQKGRFHYDTPVLQILSAVLVEASGMSLQKLAKLYLFSPLGMQVDYWRSDSIGIALGGNDAYLLPVDLIKLGELYRMGGRWNDEQVLSKAYVADSWADQIKTPTRSVNHNTLPVKAYGYLWWRIDLDGATAHAALGHGGQILVILPQRDLVVLMTSRWPGSSSRAHYQHLVRVLKEGVLPLFPGR